ncbi:MAG: Fmu (Sun) domain-containing protein [Lacibacter sp.]|jgi:16S rRNA (cytosine967-C5)-methyltransferase
MGFIAADLLFFATVSRYYSYFNTAVNFVRSYTHDEPFASFLKKQFAADKKFGSRDRKTIAHLCYCYFRMGHLMERESVQERMIAGLFLCSGSESELLLLANPDWNEKAVLPINEKLQLLRLNATDLFPFVDELSEGIDTDAFCKSHFTQPDLFLRIRPGYKETVLQKLTDAGIGFELKSAACIAVPTTTKVAEILLLNKEAVVQDYNSQMVGDLLFPLNSQGRNYPWSVWDCCAASGGKSIMAKDILDQVELTVSDLRETILFNLKKRFAEAGVTKYKSFVADLSAENLKLPSTAYDLIIADVPCSGSGTWGRTPEQMRSFESASIDSYSQLQQKIAAAVVPQLKQQGYLLYITCSVYKKENEEVVQMLQKQCSLQLLEQRLLKGYHEKADTMFAALLQKP